MSNESTQRLSISFIIIYSLILVVCSTFTLSNASIWIPSLVSDGMSNSNAIINHHSPISLYLHIWNCSLLLWMKWEKEDLINQSISIILFIINSFDSTVSISPCKVSYPRVIDWSRIKSHSSIIQSFILSNTILWQWKNAVQSNWMDMREGRFFNSSDSYQ